ncbi:MAG TPA: porin [bacterium]|nr:porin [bacterium]
MKKLTIAASLLALSLSLPVHAEDSAAGGVEFSGNVDIVTGWQHDDNAAIGDISGGLRDFRGATAPNRDTFGFYVDQVELDIQKSFGERIRLRADLDFGRSLSGSGRNTDTGLTGSNFELEQGYVTLGVLKGEFLIGRFNIPMGYYLVDRADNVTISFSNIYNFVTPTNGTGAKMYWAFGDHFDFHLYLVNNLYDCVIIGAACLVGPPGSGADSAIPSWGMRLGFNWGEEGKKSTVGLSYAGGPEQPDNNAHLDHMINMDLAWKITENFLLAAEFHYQQRNNLPTVAGPNAKFLGGLLVLDYALSDVWDIYFSYGYIHDFQGKFTGADQQIHNFVIGAGYQITDGAKMKLEYRMDLHHFASTTGSQATLVTPAANGDTTSLSHAIAAEFAYNF